MGLTDASDSRLVALTRWVTEDLGFADGRIEPASADASFRRYFRLTRGADTYIVMDAPPDKESVGPFVKVARLLAGLGLNVPIVLAREERQGFLLLSDLGSHQYLDSLLQREARRSDVLYDDALAALVIMQTAAGPAAAAMHDLPRYDRPLLLKEMELMPEWFLGKHLGLSIPKAMRATLDRLFEVLVQAALAQPRAFVHRDYHSRNLLIAEANNPGILDFQDAVIGPVTYDAVSLLKDCYIAWPRPMVHGWLRRYQERLSSAGFAAGVDFAQFLRWFDLMGLQRHIKVLGIFARLYHRDGKAGYLKDLPLVLAYTKEAAETYPETAEFAELLGSSIEPEFVAAQARVLPGLDA